MRDKVFRAMLEASDDHWWFRGRLRVVKSVLDRIPLTPPAVALDAGCGSGATMDELAERADSVYGVDVSEEAVQSARARGHEHVERAPVEQLPFGDATFDLVTCLDVIEHTPDDVVALKELLRVAKPGGYLLVTVPAYRFLWSEHDEENLHYRRYRRSSLRRAAASAGWEVADETSFNTILLPPIAAVRVARRALKASGNGGSSDFDLTPARLNTVLELPMRAEAALIRQRWRLPAGLSHLALLRRAP